MHDPSLLPPSMRQRMSSISTPAMRHGTSSISWHRKRRRGEVLGLSPRYERKNRATLRLLLDNTTSPIASRQQAIFERLRDCKPPAYSRPDCGTMQAMFIVSTCGVTHNKRRRMGKAISTRDRVSEVVSSCDAAGTASGRGSVETPTMVKDVLSPCFPRVGRACGPNAGHVQSLSFMAFLCVVVFLKLSNVSLGAATSRLSTR